MATSLAIASRVYEYLSRPNSVRLNIPTILAKLAGRIDYYRNQLSLTDSNWNISSLLLNTDSSNDEYNISAQAGDFARPILVESFDETGDPNFVRREVEIVDLQNLDILYQGRRQAGSGSSTFYPFGKHSMIAIAFFGMPEVKARIVPVPATAETYRVYYETGKKADPLLAQEPALMKQFHDLLAVHTAILCIPDASWDDLPMEAQPSKRMEIQRTLDPELGRLWMVFDRYRRTSKHDQASGRTRFNAYRSRGGGRGGW